MRRARALVCFALAGGASAAFVAVALAGCAGLVGADFDDPHLGVSNGDGGFQPVDSAAPPPGNGKDSAVPGRDANVPVIVAEGGTCPPGLTNCSGLCVDTLNDPDHCGKCGTSCPSDPNGAAVCVKSHCTFACDQGWEECAGGCCDTSTDAAPGADTAVPPVQGPDAATSSDPGILCGAGSTTARCPVASNSFCCGGKATGDTCDTNLTDLCATEVFCDNAAECGQSGVCCYDTATTQTLCQPACGPTQRQLCDPAASNECAAGTQCTGTFNPSAGSASASPGTSYTSCQ
jgi:hypothetical protein